MREQDRLSSSSLMATTLSSTTFGWSSSRLQGFLFFLQNRNPLPSNFSIKFDIQTLVDTLAYLIKSQLEAYIWSFDHQSKIGLRAQDVHWQILPMYCSYMLKKEKQNTAKAITAGKANNIGKKKSSSTGKTSFKAYFSNISTIGFL